MKAANETDQFIADILSAKRRTRAMLADASRSPLDPTAVRRWAMLTNMLTDMTWRAARLNQSRLTKEPGDAEIFSRRSL